MVLRNHGYAISKGGLSFREQERKMRRDREVCDRGNCVLVGK